MRNITNILQFVMQRLAVVVFVAAALALLVATAMAAFGNWAWISIPMQYQGAPVENAGMYAQIGLTALAISLCFFLPSSSRVMQLENSHRQFSVGMQDVARAYAAVHAADRKQNFQLSSEFDAVRERLAYLRDHPDLSTLEPKVLEIAAQMSHMSAELAEVYSDDKISRARSFLEQRQEEIDLFNSRLDQAKGISTEMKQWVHEVELEESVCAAQLERLREEMATILPELGIEKTVQTLDIELDQGSETDEDEIGFAAQENTVIEMSQKAAE
ncbi:DNA repair protein [Sulfitobacter aestuariivivens]|uniref:DNA repair protein n=2 Tax=Sulfitobacter aestuariivivens TaxID=2766981 RepID=A0A927HFR7_9RHOB|nr:DNA repair protein [Sulfitobacter aestuariivivens]